MRCQHCERPVYRRGMCSAHYWRYRRHGDPRPEVPTQREQAQQRYGELLDLIGHGESALVACQRVGANPEAAARWAYRNGQPELARLLSRKVVGA